MKQEVDILLDDKSLYKDFNVFVKNEYERPTSPEVDHKTMEIPDMPGAWYFGSEVKSREFKLPCVLSGKDSADFQKSIKKLNMLLYNKKGKPREIRLSFSDEPDIYYNVRAKDDVIPERMAGLGEFDLNLIAHDPHGYSTNRTADGPKDFLWNESGHTVTVYNHGNIRAKLSIEGEGVAENIEVKNKTSGEKASVDEEIEHFKISSRSYEISADVIEDTTKEKKDNWFFLSSGFPIKYSETERETKKKHFFDDSDFIYLDPGANELEFKGEDPAMNIKLRWNHTNF